MVVILDHRAEHRAVHAMLEFLDFHAVFARIPAMQKITAVIETAKAAMSFPPLCIKLAVLNRVSHKATRFSISDRSF